MPEPELPEAAGLQERLAALRREHDELEHSLPRHSVKPSQLMRLEELEDAIAGLEAALSSSHSQGAASSGTMAS